MSFLTTNLQKLINQAQQDLDQTNSLIEPSSLPLAKLPHGPALLMGTFLGDKEIARLSIVNKKFNSDLKKSMEDRKIKKKAPELLDLVFNKPSCKMVQEWLDINKITKSPAVKSIILVRAACEENYYSKKEKKKICKRKHNNISALEAAAISGDNFLVRTLLAHVPDNQKYEACLQLQRIRNSKEYLEPYFILQKAYKEFIEQEPILSAAGQSKELDNLELQIGLRQRNLPTYGIQEYCGDIPFSPLPSFDKEPKRSCRYYDDSEFDLDLIGTSWILYKGSVRGRARALCLVGWPVGARVAQLDLAAISHLCEIRTSELDSIIQSLQQYKPEEVDTQIAIGNANSRKLKV